MAKLQKFLFDNFVISEDEDTVSSPISEPIEEHPQDATEVVSWAEEPTKYSAAELDAATDKARANGYKEGFAAHKAEVDNQKMRLLEEINGKLLLLSNKTKDLYQETEDQFVELGKVMLQQFIPPLADENAAEIVKKFMADNFKNCVKEPHLAFYCNSAVLEEVQETISKLANKNDFEGKISIHKDDSMGKSDCAIEWDNGGVCRNTADLTNKAEQILSSAEQAKGE